MTERVIDRRGRRNWDPAKRQAEDQRMSDRRSTDRRQTQRRQGERRGEDLRANDPTLEDRRERERRGDDRRAGDRRQQDRRDPTHPNTLTLRGILGDRLGTVHSLALGSNLVDAAQLLSVHRIGIVVVVDGEGGLVGVLSERDVVRAFAENHGQAWGVLVDEYATRGVWACSLDDTPEQAMSLMHEHHMRHLPVLDDGHIVGMISASDLIGVALLRD